MYPCVFIARRVVYVVTAMGQTKYPFFQIQFLNFFNSLYFIYLGYHQPKVNRKMNKIELFNEFVFQVFCYHTFCFTEWVNKDTQYLIGQSFIYLTILLVMADLAFLASDFYEPVRQYLYHRWLINQLVQVEKDEKV